MNRRSFLAGMASAPALAVPSASKPAASLGPFAWSGPPPANERLVWTNSGTGAVGKVLVNASVPSPRVKRALQKAFRTQ